MSSAVLSSVTGCNKHIRVLQEECACGAVWLKYIKKYKKRCSQHSCSFCIAEVAVFDLEPTKVKPKVQYCPGKNFQWLISSCTVSEGLK